MDFLAGCGVRCGSPSELKGILCDVHELLKLLVTRTTNNSMTVKICFEWISDRPSTNQPRNNYTAVIDDLCLTKNNSFQMIQKKLIQIVPHRSRQNFVDLNPKSRAEKVSCPSKALKVFKEDDTVIEPNVKYKIVENTPIYDLPVDCITVNKRSLESCTTDENCSEKELRQKKQKLFENSGTQNNLLTNNRKSMVWVRNLKNSAQGMIYSNAVNAVSQTEALTDEDHKVNLKLQKSVDLKLKPNPNGCMKTMNSLSGGKKYEMNKLDEEENGSSMRVNGIQVLQKSPNVFTGNNSEKNIIILNPHSNSYQNGKTVSNQNSINQRFSMVGLNQNSIDQKICVVVDKYDVNMLVNTHSAFINKEIPLSTNATNVLNLNGISTGNCSEITKSRKIVSTSSNPSGVKQLSAPAVIANNSGLSETKSTSGGPSQALARRRSLLTIPNTILAKRRISSTIKANTIQVSPNAVSLLKQDIISEKESSVDGIFQFSKVENHHLNQNRNSDVNISEQQGIKIHSNQNGNHNLKIVQQQGDKSHILNQNGRHKLINEDQNCPVESLVGNHETYDSDRSDNSDEASGCNISINSNVNHETNCSSSNENHGTSCSNSEKIHEAAGCNLSINSDVNHETNCSNSNENHETNCLYSNENHETNCSNSNENHETNCSNNNENHETNCSNSKENHESNCFNCDQKQEANLSKILNPEISMEKGSSEASPELNSIPTCRITENNEFGRENITGKTKMSVIQQPTGGVAKQRKRMGETADHEETHVPKKKTVTREEVLKMVKNFEVTTVDLDPCNLDDQAVGLKENRCFECGGEKYRSKQTLLQHWKTSHLQSVLFGEVCYTAVKCHSCTLMEDICQGGRPSDKQVLQGMSLLLTHKMAAHNFPIPNYVKVHPCVMKKCSDGPFISRMSIIEHVRQSHCNNFKFKCTLCKELYNTAAYWTHVMKCAHYRSIEVNKARDLKAVVIDNVKNDFSCVFCRKHVGYDVTFDDKISLVEHFKVQHALDNKNGMHCFCPFCDKRIGNPPQELDATPNQAVNGKFENEPVYKLFIQMSIHIQVKHRKNLRKSSSLDAFCFFKNCTFKVKIHNKDNLTTLLRHSWKHKPKIACHRCGKTYPQTSSTNHASQCSKLLNGTEVAENFVCDICGKVFLCEATLSSHTSKVHVRASRELRCDKCDYKTVHSVVLEEHLFRVHNLNPNNKPTYDCEVCDYSSLLRCNYKSHVSKQHGARLTVCHVCGKIVAACSLSKHKETHTEKNILCPQCDFRTNLQSYLKKHMDAVHNKRRFACKSCGYTTAYSSNIASHKKKYCKNLEHNKRRDELKQQRQLEKLQKAAERARNRKKEESIGTVKATFKSRSNNGKKCRSIPFVDDTEEGFGVEVGSTMLSMAENESREGICVANCKKLNQKSGENLLNGYAEVDMVEGGSSDSCDYFVDGQEIKVQNAYEGNEAAIVEHAEEDLNLIGSDVIYVNDQSNIAGSDAIDDIDQSDLGSSSQSLLDDEFCAGSPESNFRNVVDEQLLSGDI